MSEVQTRKSWFEMESSERLTATVDDALQVLGSVLTGSKWGRQSVEGFVEFLVQMDYGDKNLFEIRYRMGVLCLLAVYLPNVALKPLSENLTDSPLWEESRLNVLDCLNIINSRTEMTRLLVDFVQRFSPPMSNFDLGSISKKINYGIGSFERNIRFRFLSLASLDASEALSQRRRDSRVDLGMVDEDDGPSSESQPEAATGNSHMERPLDNKDESTLISGDHELNSVQEYWIAKKEMKGARFALERAYARLQFRDVIEVKGRTNLVAGCVALLLMLYMCIATIAGSSMSFIGEAHAESGAEASLPHKFPPLGLSQSSWEIMVLVFFAYLMLVLTSFLWKGYFAKEKSEIAADAVKSIIALGVGLFFGRTIG